MPDQDRHPDENFEAVTQPAQPGGDQIELKDIGSGAAVAAGRGARANVYRFDDIHWWPAFIALMVVVGLMALLFFELRPNRPDKMQGQFNVAVAEFSVQDKNGNSVRSEDGQELAMYLSQQ